ncbi:GspE/PulE family protein [Veronia pacifica]|uniref:MSHA biogenesis protein MshE n=1 Tax=Veronia pacifica TaxID=1080227 RepID=A0A1C3ELN1_9GAMM|nr:GspE/PulE family protein [Veronia pacifica]ODA34148.1 MSHA biogenesis protein MshE [Veronia pacifica]
MAIKLRKRIGDLLVEEGIIQLNQLQSALALQYESGRKLGDILVEMSLLTEHQLMAFLARQLGLEAIDFNSTDIDENVVGILPEVHARRLRAMVIARTTVGLRVAMSDPADLAAQDAVMELLRDHQVELVIAAERQLITAFDRYYRKTQAIASFAERLEAEHRKETGSAFGDTADDAQDVTVVKLINSLFEDAVQMNASDIHIEPDEKVLRIRQRIDGNLHETLLKESGIASALVLRLKLMSELDISEKRLPQDGRFHIKVRDMHIDVRLSTLPVEHGEAVVMRLLNQSAGLLSLEQVGMPADLLLRFRSQLHRPYGMILVTGPTGSGKTTTLYGALNELNTPDKKILTAEDPVEYRLTRVSQVQINHKVGLTFSNALRTFLRQDPDIILVGEMRDSETVEIGLRASMTGHLVLSTLHTNNAIDSALRLVDMEAPGYLVASAVKAVLAQRLIKRNCPDCNAVQATNAHHKIWLNSQHPAFSQRTFSRGKGCQTCSFTGYKGRIGVFELLEITPELAEALRSNDHNAFANAAQQQSGYRSLVDCALELAASGQVSLEQAISLSESAPLITDVEGRL